MPLPPKHWVLATGVLLAWAALYLGAARGAAGEIGLPLDDAWIHARIARHAASGAGFTFNPGERAAPSSAPLWTLLLAGIAGLGVPFPWASLVPGIALTAIVAALGSRVVLRATGDRAAG